MEAFGAQAPKVVKRLKAAFEEGVAVMALRARHRRRLRTAKVVERLEQEMRR
ncbi:MAG: hypothetical protein ACUVS3_12605 [Thermodesulfobacteriota bacterium]